MRYILVRVVVVVLLGDRQKGQRGEAPAQVWGQYRRNKWPAGQASLLQSWVALGQPSGPNLEDSRYGIRHLEQALKTAGRVLQPYLGNGR